MNLVTLRDVWILLTISCINICFFLMIFKYNSKEKTYTKFSDRLNMFHQILKQEGIFLLNKIVQEVQITLLSLVKQNGSKFGLDFHIEYDTGKKVQKQMSKAEEQFHNNTKSACSQQPRLLPILGSENSTLELAHSVLMMETSGRGRLTGRQACAVESAARRFQEQKHKSLLFSLIIPPSDLGWQLMLCYCPLN